MRFSRFSVFTLIICSLMSSACGPSLRSTMQVPDIPSVSKKPSQVGSVTNAYLSIDDFQDMRPSAALAEVNGRESSAATSVDIPVRDALAKALEKNGFIISDSAPVVMVGQVKEWKADVHTGMPSSINSRAAVYLEVLDPANKKIYSGTYQGRAMSEQASIDETDVRRTLGSAMSEALSQVVADERLMSLLLSF